MLQNMGHTCRIRWVCLEADTEDIILVVPRNMQIVRIGLVMSQPHGGQVKLRNVLLLANSEAVELLANSREAVDVGNSRSRPYEGSCP